MYIKGKFIMHNHLDRRAYFSSRVRWRQSDPKISAGFIVEFVARQRQEFAGFVLTFELLVKPLQFLLLEKLDWKTFGFDQFHEWIWNNYCDSWN